jgi:hypothetical protein
VSSRNLLVTQLELIVPDKHLPGREASLNRFQFVEDERTTLVNFILHFKIELQVPSVKRVRFNTRFVMQDSLDLK